MYSLIRVGRNCYRVYLFYVVITLTMAVYYWFPSNVPFHFNDV